MNRWGKGRPTFSNMIRRLYVGGWFLSPRLGLGENGGGGDLLPIAGAMGYFLSPLAGLGKKIWRKGRFRVNGRLGPRLRGDDKGLGVKDGLG